MKDSIYPLVEYAASARPEENPESILDYTKQLLLDTLGCIHAGSRAKGINELRQAAKFWGGNSQATVFAFDEKSSAPSAAFLNSVMGHANDFDDTHDGAVNHGCVTLVPALLATCEALSIPDQVNRPDWLPSRKISGKEFIAALAIGLDISNRLGMAFIPYLHVGWLPTTLWGPFACAAACGRLLGLDAAKMLHAFGLAYSQIHANRQGLLDGALSKRIQPGFSAEAGVKSAFLAAAGISGARNIVDGEFGLRSLYTDGKIDADYLSQGIGESFETSNVSIKPYPCCRCAHAVIDAALLLKEQHHIQWRDIEKGEIYLPPQSFGQIGGEFQLRDNPTVDAQFSAAYTAALAFYKGWPVISDFARHQVISQKQVIELALRFDTIEFEKHNSRVSPIEMSLGLKNGQTRRVRIEQPKGSKTNPLSSEELIRKFNGCLDLSIKEFSETERKEIIKAIDGLLLLDDINELIRRV